MNFKKIKDIVIYLTVVLVVILIWFAFSSWIDKYIILGDKPTQELMAMRGQFGDKFGAVNSLFSGLAFAGIIITLLLQRRDLEETRSAMGHERFDNTFFQLLRLHIDITTRMDTRGGKGIEAFIAFTESTKRADDDFYAFAALQKLSRAKVRTIIDMKKIAPIDYPELNTADITNLDVYLSKGVSAFENYLDQSIEMHEEKVSNACIKSSLEHIDYFSHYFRNLYHILKFIDESNLIQDDQKRMYSKYVRSQLSDTELVCIFYNSICPIKGGFKHEVRGISK